MDDNDTDTSVSDSISLVEEEIMTVARDMQNRGSRRVGAKVVEDRLFNTLGSARPSYLSCGTFSMNTISFPRKERSSTFFGHLSF